MNNLYPMQQYSNLRELTPSRAQIWAIGGGKGGVGKSFVSSGLALFLAHQGYATVLMDLDLGAANLHSYLNLPKPSLSLQQAIYNRNFDLESLMIDTHIPNLKLISSHSEDTHVLELTNEEKSMLMSSIYNLHADFIILDLSAGTHETTLDLFNCAQKHIVVATPEPVSIENAYKFMKEAFYRKMRRLEKQLNLDRLIADIMKNREHYQVRTPADLVHTLVSLEPDNGMRLKYLLENYSFQILINQARSHKDKALGNSMKSVCLKYFGVDTDYLGCLDYDNAVWQSLRNRKHLLMQNPHSNIYNQLLSITRTLIDPNSFRKVAY